MLFRSQQKARIIFVISFISSKNILETVENLQNVISAEDEIILVNQSTEELQLFFNDKNGPNITLLFDKGLGLSRGRNLGIEFAFSHFSTFSGFVFPNDISEYSPNTISEMRSALINSPSRVEVGSWRDTNGNELMTPYAIYDDSRKPLRIYEPAIIFPRSVFLKGLRFDERIGTGSAGPWQSGEGSQLILECLLHGVLIEGNEKIVCINPGSRRDLSIRYVIRKAFYYGAGTGRYYRKNMVPGNLNLVLGLSFSPCIGYVIGKKYWRSQGLIFSVAATTGRFFGLIFSQ